MESDKRSVGITEFGSDLHAIFANIVKGLPKKSRNEWEKKIREFKQKHKHILTGTDVSYSQEMNIEMENTSSDIEDIPEHDVTFEATPLAVGEDEKANTLRKLMIASRTIYPRDQTFININNTVVPKSYPVMVQHVLICYEIIGNSKCNIIMAAIRAGQIYERVKRRAPKTLPQFIQETPFSKSWVYFLIRLFLLSLTNGGLVECGLTLKELRGNISRLEKNLSDWKEWQQCAQVVAPVI